MTRVLDRRSVVPIVIALLAIAAVAYFDLQTNLTIVDEYARRWTIQRIADGRGLVFWGSSPNLVQIASSLPLALLHLEPRFWRLAGLPFLGAGAVFSWLISRSLGADRFWAAIAAALVVASPIVMSLATGMMTETAFIALLLGASWFSLRWVSDGKGIGWAIGLALLCTLQRQQGVALAALVTAGLFLVRHRRPIVRRDLVGAIAMWVVVLGALAAVEFYRRLGPVAPGGDSISYGPVVVVVVAVAYLPILCGFMLVPLLVGMLGRSDDEKRLRGRIEVAPVAVAAFGIIFVLLTVALLHTSIFVGYVYGAKGLNDARELTKPDLLPLPIFVAIEALTIASVTVLLVWRRKMWRPSVLGIEGILLLLLAGTQFVAIIGHGQIFDRYYVPVLAPLAPLLATIASRSAPRRWGALWASGLLAAGLALYVVGEQDHLAWLNARDQAALAAYAQVPADQVLAGYEEIATHVWVPAMDDATGTKPRSIVPRPRLVLISTGPDDPRPGFMYSSISPGKVVIQVDDGG